MAAAMPLTARLLLAAALLGGSAAAWSQATRIEVVRADGSRQCEPDSGVPLSTMAAELTAAGIAVHASRSADDGMMRPAVCGAPTGTMHVFQIDAADLPQAQQLGFRPLPAAPR